MQGDSRRKSALNDIEKMEKGISEALGKLKSGIANGDIDPKDMMIMFSGTISSTDEEKGSLLNLRVGAISPMIVSITDQLLFIAATTSKRKYDGDLIPLNVVKQFSALLSVIGSSVASGALG